MKIIVQIFAFIFFYFAFYFMSLSACLISGRLYLLSDTSNNIYFECEGSIIVGIMFSAITIFNLIDENKKIINEPNSFKLTLELIRKSFFLKIFLSWIGFIFSYCILELIFEYFHLLSKYEWVCFIVALLFGFSIKDISIHQYCKKNNI